MRKIGMGQMIGRVCIPEQYHVNVNKTFWLLQKLMSSNITAEIEDSLRNTICTQNHQTNMQQKATCNLFAIASFSKLELLTTLERFLVSCPSSRASCKTKRRLPTAYLRNASPRTSSLSREKCSLHFSVVSASRTWTSLSIYPKLI